MPTFIVSDPEWAKKFESEGIPVVGDDIKSQVGATIVHRTLVQLFLDRGVKIDRTYQLNFGGNTDFLNMLERSRLKTKKVSKTQAVESLLPYDIGDQNIHIGPSDWVPWLKDRKIAYIRLEGRLFGDVPISLELKLDVEDSPNSAGSMIDAIRCCKLARDRGIGGPLYSISAYTMKHPPIQYPDWQAKRMVEEFIRGERER
jgi:myo-inositol-1-phosphate synthase